MNRLILVAFLAATTIGCGLNPVYVDNIKRRELFLECMKALPAGPQQTQYNDWDEVVKACDNAAYFQAQTVKPCESCVYSHSDGAPR
jgi:hypothetical protein